MRLRQDNVNDPDQIGKVLAAIEEAGATGDIDNRDARAAIEILRRLLERLDKLEARADRAERNLAAQQAMLDDRLLRLEHSRLFRILNGIVARLTAVRRAPVSEEDAAYARWFACKQAETPTRGEAISASNDWSRKPRLSILISVKDAGSLPKILESVGSQIYENWDLCIAANATNREEVSAAARDFEKLRGPGSCLVREFANDADVLNEFARLAAGEYLIVIDEPAILSPEALYFIVETLQSDPFDLLYSDEDAISPDGSHVRPLFKPDWSPTLLESRMYIGGVAAMRRAFLLERGHISDARSWLDGISQAAFELRLVRHIPRVLYHSLPEAHPRGRLARECGTGTMRADPMAVIVCSRTAGLLEKCLGSVRETSVDMTPEVIVVAHEESGVNAELRSVAQRYGAACHSFCGPFNFSAMNNLGAAAAQAPNLLFINDDVRATHPGWAEILARQLLRKEVGAAGAVLRYPSGTLQHAGIAVGIHDGVGHVGRHMRSSALWPWLFITREVSAVTGACLAVRKDVFQELGGFDTGFPTNYNDVDLCLRMRERGYKIINVAAPGLIHAECQTRQGIVRFHERFHFFERWGDVLRSPDLYYSTSLSPTEKIALDFDGKWVGNVPIGRASGI
ncbi:MAG TPA: glycosyltransferase [Bryobacteraceae bacterium]|jgi:hypothetical protein